MARDLVPYNPLPGNDSAAAPTNGANGHGNQKPESPYTKIPVGSHNDPDPGHWDLPPTNPPRSYAGSYHAAQQDFHQAQAAERDGDQKRARGRRQDAEENLQQTWDWGDLKTWLIIALMFFFGITLACTAYVLPHGRDASPPLIEVH